MNNDSFVLSLLNEKVKLSAKYLNKNYKQHLLKLLQDRNEGKCSKHGYIKKGSIEIKRVSVGALEIQSLRGFVNYDIQFSAMVCNPTKGSILKCTVLNSNNFGVLCVCGLNNGPNFVPIIDIIIPKNSLTIRSDSDINVE
jgi:DNA-directed RNA polymerase subunit E'/Rpb7